MLVVRCRDTEMPRAPKIRMVGCSALAFLKVMHCIHWITVIVKPKLMALVGGLGDCLRAGTPSRYVTSHPGELSLSSLRGR